MRFAGAKKVSNAVPQSYNVVVGEMMMCLPWARVAARIEFRRHLRFELRNKLRLWAAPPRTNTARCLIPRWLMIESDALSGRSKRIREWNNAINSVAPSEAIPSNYVHVGG